MQTKGNDRLQMRIPPANYGHMVGRKILPEKLLDPPFEKAKKRNPTLHPITNSILIL